MDSYSKYEKENIAAISSFGMNPVTLPQISNTKMNFEYVENLKDEFDWEGAVGVRRLGVNPDIAIQEPILFLRSSGRLLIDLKVDKPRPGVYTTKSLFEFECHTILQAINTLSHFDTEGLCRWSYHQNSRRGGDWAKPQLTLNDKEYYGVGGLPAYLNAMYSELRMLLATYLIKLYHSKPSFAV